MSKSYALAIICLSFICWQCSPKDNPQPASLEQVLPVVNMNPSKKVNGLNFVAPPKPFPNNPMLEVQNISANWIAVIPFGYCRVGEAKVHYGSQWQWWGEKYEGAKKTIELAKAAGIKVMLKPQVYVPGSWTGAIDFEKESDWESWEKDYTQYLMQFVQLADSLEVDMICIGTEFKISEVKRPNYWRKLIKEIRTQYQGKLTYAANWDSYDKLSFWDALDFVGIDAYFPLTEEKTPSVESLKQLWRPQVQSLREFHKTYHKPILFTEYGYLSVDGCAWRNWELDRKMRSLAINQQAQTNALEALYQSFYPEPFWGGGFLWKWFPNMEGHEGAPERDYSPQGKMAEKTVKKWFDKE